jgi:hypothetical protein
MSFLRIYKFSRSSYLLALILIFPLFSCSGGDGGDTSVSSTGYTPVPSVFGVLGLSWTTPDRREDGTVLLISEILEYRIYYGTTAGDYQSQFNVDVASNTAQVPQLSAGTYYAVVTAVDTEGRESLYSPEVVINI